MKLGTENKKLANEIIATLVHIKSTMVQLILKPAGIPPSAYQGLLYQRDPETGRPLSKRDIAPLILDAIETEPNRDSMIRSLIEIAAHWSSFHLAYDEYAARATVQKAREVLDIIELMEERESKQRELARKEELERFEKERAKIIRQQSELLLMMFDDMARSDNPQGRGYLLEDLMNRTFDLFGIPVTSSFRRNSSGEQIDGAFKLEGWHYLLECKWKQKLSDIQELDGLSGKVNRSGKQAMGFFLSINGWSKHVPSLLKQNPEKSILLMDGYDLRCILSGQVDFQDFLLAKVARLNNHSEPFYSATEFLKDQDI